jgi:LysR family transcriptional regulator, glycine cleavage system transcriptional activator
MNLARISLSALRAFEVAARLGRQKAAAAALGVTHGAISRQIAQLEESLGISLFEGPRSKPVLSAEGRTLAPALTRAFDDIEMALREVSHLEASRLDIACLSSFAIRWLIPRLHRFHQLAPDLDLRLSTNDELIAQEPGRFDLLIRVLEPGAPLFAHDVLLFEERIGPVLRSGEGQQSLCASPRLGTVTRPNAWTLWDELTGAPAFSGGVRAFEHYSFAIEAAANGLGACVAPHHLVVDDLQGGRLVAPLGFVATGYHYVLRRGHPREAKIECFTAWMKHEVELLMPSADA